MNQKRIPADRVKWENKLDKPKKWGKESYNLRQNYTCAECPKGGEPGPLGVKDGQLTPRVHIRETAPQERSPTWAPTCHETLRLDPGLGPLSWTTLPPSLFPGLASSGAAAPGALSTHPRPSVPDASASHERACSLGACALLPY